MIVLSGLENERLWNVIKTDRLKYIIDNMATHASGWCFADDDFKHSLVSNDDIIFLVMELYQIKDLQQGLQLPLLVTVYIHLYIVVCNNSMNLQKNKLRPFLHDVFLIAR